MEIKVFCYECISELEKRGLKSGEVDVDFYWTPLKTSPFTEWTCSKGHINYFWISAPFYDLLYSKALTNLARFDTRSAVSNSYSAWENFVSHTNELLLQKSEIQKGWPKPTAIRRAINRSEPALGMYIGLYVSAIKRFPRLPEQTITEKRNDVIHGSEIPSEEEALKVVEEIRNCIKEAIDSLRPLHKNYYTGPEAGKRAKEDFEKSINFLKAPPAFYYMNSLVDENIEDKVKRIRDEMKEKKAL